MNKWMCASLLPSPRYATIAKSVLNDIREELDAKELVENALRSKWGISTKEYFDAQSITISLD